MARFDFLWNSIGLLQRTAALSELAPPAGRLKLRPL